MTRLAIQSIVNLQHVIPYPFDESIIPYLAAFQITSLEGGVLRRGFRVRVSEEKNDICLAR